jgi:hypothetical protein
MTFYKYKGSEAKKSDLNIAWVKEGASIFKVPA